MGTGAEFNASPISVITSHRMRSLNPASGKCETQRARKTRKIAFLPNSASSAFQFRRSIAFDATTRGREFWVVGGF